MAGLEVIDRLIIQQGLVLLMTTLIRVGTETCHLRFPMPLSPEVAAAERWLAQQFLFVQALV